jgi:hypothetical protein
VPITSIVKQCLDFTYGPSNPDWVQFVDDHIDYILANSAKFELTPQTAERYAYRMRQFLKLEMSRHYDIEWIVLKINGIPNDFEFRKQITLSIPEDSFISDLYQKFMSSQSEEVI